MPTSPSQGSLMMWGGSIATRYLNILDKYIKHIFIRGYRYDGGCAVMLCSILHIV